jgi:hypothetical protein
MPLINLFIFPILGGYYILIRAELFRYRQQRLEPQKLIFNSFLGGTILIIVSWCITGLLTYFLPDQISRIKTYYPVTTAYFGTCVTSFFIGILFTELSNIVVNKDRRVSRAIDKIGNELERLCESCYRNAQLIQVTLSNDKCYVGLVKALPIPSHSSYIRLLPVYSGYRKSETKELVFTTQYLDVYASYVSEGQHLDTREITNIVIKIDDIVSATKFDIEMYDRFLKQNKDDQKTEELDNSI